ncbi:hypothetical protein GWI34_09920 [Actinomadura sp. DSM 109109]|nr:hypothetical protein [Actinomadura lepetitiana]
MGEARHPAFRRPAARLLVVVLGLLGFVAGPVGPVGAGPAAGAGPHGRSPSTGTLSGARPGPVAQGHARTRAAARTRPAGRAQTVIAAPVLHTAGAAAPHAQPPHATPPASGAEVRPPSGRLARTTAAHAAPDLAPRSAPRGRAPPSSTGI